MLDFESFLSERRSCLVAPAGYGKTYTIVECLKRACGRQLILTHTHAGVASLHEKLHAARIPTSRYELSTISALAQQLSVCFTSKDHVVSCDDRNFFTWSIERATTLLGIPAISKVFNTSFTGIFVDEYQDCTISQHNLLLALAGQLPMRVFGDPMQGIFGFNEPIVDFGRDLCAFKKYILTEPQRWKNTNPVLGTEISQIRHDLECNRPIDGSRFSAIKFMHVKSSDVQKKIMDLHRGISREESALVIVSNSMSRKTRCNVAKLFGGRCSIVEAVDDKEFYCQARTVDGVCAENCDLVLYELATSLFFKTQVDNWLSIKGPKRKQLEEDQVKSRPLVEAVKELRKAPSPGTIYDCIQVLLEMEDVRLLSHEKCYSLLSAIRCAQERGETVLEAMRETRNVARGMGRHIRPFSVGSTLLTKGLEFDHVIVCDYAPGFNLSTTEGKRNFYVAISRACKSLYIIRSDLM